MKRRDWLSVFGCAWLCVLTLPATGQSMHRLQGFAYGQKETPTGQEWETPDKLSLNKEQPRAYFFSYKSIDAARQILPDEQGAYYISLDGQWKFHWVGHPDQRPVGFEDPGYDVSEWDNITVPGCWNVQGIQQDGTLKYGTPIYANQPFIFKHSVEPGDWRGGVMRTPSTDWVTYKDRNEVGSYRRDFILPDDWGGQRVFVNFDGVNSFFYLWINGKYVGFSKNSRSTASFDITSYLRKGINVLATEVYRSSDGSFLEAQDMWRLPGIFRSVYLTGVPDVHVRDFAVTPDLDATYADGTLHIRTEVRNLSKKDQRGLQLRYTLYSNELYTQNTYEIPAGASVTLPVGDRVERGRSILVQSDFSLPAPRLWSAEEPNLYTLVGELLDRRARVLQTYSTVVGFRKVEIKDTPAEEDEFGLAGRYFYINGKAVKLRGVNRQEINPATGNAITTEQMIQEIGLMKRANINHVRLSHYPNFPQWYYLCNLYGLYLEDETNAESHGYYYGDASLSHVPEFRNSHVARSMEMVAAHVNHPSIVIWSLGNEGGPGYNFKESYDAIKAFDTSRPVQYERNNDIVDIGSNQYPSIAWMREAVKGGYDLKYPFHVSEYAHNMGNAGGNLREYWEAMESTNFFMGGAIWDWVDQALWAYDPKTGNRYLAYGGDFGDKPNDGMFCMNGILLPTHEPKPAYYEVKKVQQEAKFTVVDINNGLVEIFNKRYFTDFGDLKLIAKLLKDGVVIRAEEVPLPHVAPRKSVQVKLPYTMEMVTDQSAEFFVNLELQLREDKPWAKAGFAQMEEQFLLKSATSPLASADFSAGNPALKVQSADQRTTVSGGGFEVIFDDNQGTIHSYDRDGQVMIPTGHGPKLNALRAPVDNDNWALQSWFANGLHNLHHKVTARTVKQHQNGSVSIYYSVFSQAPYGGRVEGGVSGRYRIVEQSEHPFGPNDLHFLTTQIWTVYPNGTISLDAHITSNRTNVALPRLGYALELPKTFDYYTYYGRGPWNNYNDRSAGSHMGKYSSSVSDQFVPFPKPQSMGNREDVRYARVTEAEGSKVGLKFVARDKMSVSVLPYSTMELMLAPHPHQLPESSYTHVHLDYGVTGLGGNSCGQGAPLVEDRVMSGTYDFGFIITAPDTECPNLPVYSPVSIRRNRVGQVTLNAKAGVNIMYAVNGSKPRKYTKPFDLAKGGTVVAYPEEHSWMVSEQKFGEVKKGVASIVAVSSEETDGGAAANLLDGDPSTIWHSMYSVTVAKYPHWVVLDAGSVLLIKEFIYVPRPVGGNNGDIREYSIQVSMDGENWSEPVAHGFFPNNKSIKRVNFSRPVEGRFVRFNALSSQNGADFASGAEISISVM